MESIYLLEWSFIPADYFGCDIEIVRDDYIASIRHGKITASIDRHIYDSDPKLHDEIEVSLRDRFDGAMLVSHQAYDLSGPTRVLTHPDGRRDFFIDCKTGVLTVTGYSPDIRVTSPNGEIIYDSKQVRAERIMHVGEQIAKHREKAQPLRAMIDSYDNAIREPQNELIHLYEVREALHLRFGGKMEARSAIGAPPSAWNRLGDLCNDKNLRQGRHRGKAGTLLRDATHVELKEAQEICVQLIELYLRYLDAHGPEQP